MPSKKASSAIKKLNKKNVSEPISNTSTEDHIPATASMPGHDSKDSDASSTSTSETAQPAVESVADARPKKSSSIDDTATIKTTNSSPTDPAYVPTGDSQGGRFLRSPSMLKAPPTTPAKPLSIAAKSFFDFESSDSGEDSPVVGRASSVRMSKPQIVQQRSSSRDPVTVARSPLSVHIRETSESLDSTRDVDNDDKKRGGQAQALRRLEGREVNMVSPSVSEVAAIQQLEKNATLSEKARRGGLYMNPVTETEKSYIHRAMSAPPVPQRNSSKKVRIKPADLIIGHTKHTARLFREAVVTTPYPVLTEEKVKNMDGYADSKEILTALPHRSGTVRTTRFDADRFPSPDRPEVLFLDLGLARHPSATTTLEIRIADKGAYDDEMLFRQIRTAYRTRLLGVSRFPFCAIRGLTHATVSASVQHDFRTTEFMKHFENPRIGRKRKTWVIWLRLHSSQQHPVRSDNLNIVKRPLSASLRTADKRLSMQSDSSSTFNFSFLPPLSIPRIPFFSKDAVVPSSASTYHMPPAHGLEDGCGTIKVELHHEFSFWMLAFSCLSIVTLSVAAVVCWTVFGVPGARPGDDEVSSVITKGFPWNTAAQTRVLTGLVLGMMVALLGSILEICLVAGAYILL